LPVELKVMQELGERIKGMTVAQVRERCKEYALGFVEQNKRDFRALGVLGRWDKPYLTIDPGYEAGVLDVFSDIVGNGYVYRQLRPVHWCMSCQTTLAEAELEYGDEESPSIFVKFPLCVSTDDLFPGAGGLKAHLLIWTTTPWTLPANRAIAVHPKFEYAAVKTNGEALILAKDLVEGVMEKVGISEYEVLGSVAGSELEGKKYEHVLTEEPLPVVLAGYVNLAEGTGCVHTAPGHGAEDFLTGSEYGLETFSPVDAEGRFEEAAGEFAGLKVFDADEKICRRLSELGFLVWKGGMRHSYPHCWRCKEPVIFRATEQWFVAVDKGGLRDKLLGHIDAVRWYPHWGQIRMTSMVRERPDWCISRQKVWGVPIPAFYCCECGEVLLTKKSVLHVKEIVAREGGGVWFEKDVAELVPPGASCSKCGGKSFRKETDIFDVWFESGSSHRAVLRDARTDLGFPADLYVEGHDQHRGWFQLSLLASVAAEDVSPYRSVVTHGHVLNEKGEKMSKSLGNLVSVNDAVSATGAELVRLWTASVAYHRDIPVSLGTLKRLGDPYRRFRNTFRYMLGNLYDFDPEEDSVAGGEMLPIDRWVLSKLQGLVRAVTEAFDNYEFHRAFQALHNFCTVELSSFYFDILKDRLYTASAKGKERRSGQTALHRLLLTLVKLMAPILAYTSEEVWSHITHREPDVWSVHLTDWPEVEEEFVDEELEAEWERMIRVRGDVYRVIEQARADGVIGGSLEARVEIFAQDEETRRLLADFPTELETVFIVSEVTVKDEDAPEGTLRGTDVPGIWVRVTKCSHDKCRRCWNLRSSVGQTADLPEICDRCVAVILEEKGSET
jgi:isoleucyl-tRNA synthetase